MSLAQADATGRISLVPAPVRSLVEAIDKDLERASLGLVQPTTGSPKVARDANWFLNHRIGAVLPRIRGRLLDVGCGVNELVRRYGDGVGVQRVTDIVETEKFDTVTLVAVLNYIPEGEREQVIQACHSRLNKFGRLIITCRRPRGLAPNTVIKLVEACNFRLVYSRPFMLGLNRVYVFGKEELKTLPIMKESCGKNEEHH